MGRIMLSQKKEKEALEQFEKALSLQPNYIDPLRFIVSFHMMKKDTKKALDRVEQQIKTRPAEPPSLQHAWKYL